MFGLLVFCLCCSVVETAVKVATATCHKCFREFTIREFRQGPVLVIHNSLGDLDRVVATTESAFNGYDFLIPVNRDRVQGHIVRWIGFHSLRMLRCFAGEEGLWKK